MLAVEGLTVRFGDTRALDAVDLTVADGEVVGVLGPSGSGKSTLLRAIAGLETPAGGRVARDGVDLAGMPPHRRGIGLMFQDHALFPHRDVLANVAFGVRMRGATRTEADRRAREILSLVGLDGFDHRSVHELSGGEQQRVALARSLAPAPSLLMLDEPLGALDRRLRERLVDELAALFDRLGLGVLFVTHDHDEAFGLADRVAILRAGRVEQVGTAAEVWQRPATEFAARFLGWNVVESVGGDTGAGERVALRPDALRADPAGRLAGVVVGHAFRRDHFRARVSLDGTGEVLEVVTTGEPPPIGERLRLRTDADGIVTLPGTAPPSPEPRSPEPG